MTGVWVQTCCQPTEWPRLHNRSPHQAKGTLAIIHIYIYIHIYTYTCIVAVESGCIPTVLGCRLGGKPFQETMRKRCGDRLPSFTAEEKELIKGTSEFFGLSLGRV